jgi:hypothetical protein
MRSSMQVCGKDVQVQGGLIRIARLTADGYEFLNKSSHDKSELALLIPL